MENDIEKIAELFINVISKFYEKDSKSRTFGTNNELYHSEIHMLQYIQDHPEMHISAIARDLGITRGAASQTVKRLERKQMIVKEKNPENNLKIIMHLTPQGEIAYRNHKMAHEKYQVLIGEILSKAPPHNLQFLLDFLQQFETSLPQ